MELKKKVSVLIPPKVPFLKEPLCNGFQMKIKERGDKERVRENNRQKSSPIGRFYPKTFVIQNVLVPGKKKKKSI